MNDEVSVNDLRAMVPQQQVDSPVSVVVESDKAVAQIRGQMQLAKMYPRNEEQALTKILQACSLVPVAESAHYSFPRAGSVIEGPSIDLLKQCARYWGNIIMSVRELERRAGESTAEAVVIDLETNTMDRKEFIVPHVRDKNNDDGTSGVQIKTGRDIYEAVANMGARRLRACLETVIPPHIVGAASQRCYDTLRNADQKTPLVERLKVLVPKFREVGVTDAMLVKWLSGRAISEMTESEYIKLRNVHRSIASGAQRAEDFFDRPTVKDQITAGAAKTAAKTAANQATTATTTATTTDSTTTDTKETLLAAIAAAKTVDELHPIKDRRIAAKLAPADSKAIAKAAAERAAALAAQGEPVAAVGPAEGQFPLAGDDSDDSIPE